MLNSSTSNKRIRIDQFSPIQIRNLYAQKRVNSLRYFFPLPTALTEYQVSLHGKRVSYKVEKSENRSAFIITISWENDLGKKLTATKTSNSWYAPISSQELGQLIPKGVKTCGMIIDSNQIRIIIPMSQYDKRTLNTILKYKNVYEYNFKLNVVSGAFM